MPESGDRGNRAGVRVRAISAWHRVMARPEATAVAGTALVFAVFGATAGDWV